MYDINTMVYYLLVSFVDFFFTGAQASWDEWWTYDGISGDY